MLHDHSITRSFGPRAEAYLTSTVHAQGQDLTALADAVATTERAEVLDLGCGAGHASFAVAPFAAKVVAFDITQPMLDIVASTARERGLANIVTQQGSVDRLPFDDDSFDWAISRYSAHHWHDVPQALHEVRRVLKPEGRLLFIDIAGGPQPLLDTHLQAVELLRDSSHIRNYTAPEWFAFFQDAGFRANLVQRWRLPIEFAAWITRIATPPDRVSAIASLWAAAPQEVRSYFNVQDDLSFELDAVMFEAKS
jgi:SAM-dependent methyltransferase